MGIYIRVYWQYSAVSASVRVLVMAAAACYICIYIYMYICIYMYNPFEKKTRGMLGV